MERLQGNMNNARSVLVHVEVMKRNLALCAALRAVTSHATSMLLQSIGSNLFHWNFAALAWLVTSEAPLLHQTIKTSVAMMLCVASPRVSFPGYSSFHSLECMSRALCVSLHDVAITSQVYI